MQREFFGLGEKEMLADEFTRGIFLSSKIATIADFIPTVFWDAHVRIEQERRVDSIETAPMGMAMMSGGTVTNLQLKIGNTTNVAVEIWWPSAFSDGLELFAAPSLTEQPPTWELVCTNISTTTNAMPFVWNDMETNWTRFYIAGNADLDSDSDGTPDAREVLLYRTDPADPSSGGTPPPPAPTSVPTRVALSIKSYSYDVDYTLSLSSGTNTHTVVSTGLQTVSNTFDLVKGQSCVLSLTQAGFSQCGGEWGYVANVSGSGIVIDDPDGILGDCWQSDLIVGTATAAVHVLKVEIKEMDFQDSTTDNNYDCRNPDGTLLASDSYEIKIDDSQNYPTAYKMEANPKVKLKLKLTPALTTSVSDLLYSEGALGFGSRETPVSMDFVSGNATLVLNTTSTVSTVVRAGTYHLQWRGSCTPLNTSCKIYTVHDAPKCADALYTTNNLDICTEWADGCNKVDTSDDAKNTSRKVQLGAKTWQSVHGVTNSVPGFAALTPFTYIPLSKGDCYTYSGLMTEGLHVLGVEASNERIFCENNGIRHYFYTKDKTPFWLADDGDADGDGTKNQNETGYPGTLEGVYVWGMDTAYDDDWREANAPWQFHGACSCAGNWWEITFNSTPDHDTEAEMTKYPNGPIIKYPGHKEGEYQ